MIMENVRINSTENEKIVQTLLDGKDYKSFNMSENSIDGLLQKEKSNKFNSEYEQLNEQLEQHNENFKESQEQVQYDISKAEIKPMLSRVLIKPFKVNPFQKMEVKNGIIVDAGGYNPHTQVNPQTGKYEEQEQFIKVGCVIEVGPKVQYLKESDVVYYRKDTAVVVPFFKQGFVSVDEKNIIAVVNEGLQERFNNIK